jgi:hypothetical protein
MPRLLTISAAVLAITMLLAVSGCSTLGTQPQNKAEIVMQTGDEVTMFYGGSKEAQAVFCPGETVEVYRAESRQRLRYIKEGKVEITRVIDENYVEGKVVEGNVKPGYVARKGNVGCLVTPQPAERRD